MAPPPDLKVCVEALKKEAEIWDSNGRDAAGVQYAAEGLRMSGLQAGIFAMVLEAYNEVCTFVSDAGRGAAKEMSEAAEALLENARAYERNEADITESVPRGY